MGVSNRRIKGYLIIRNGDEVRWVNRRPNLQPNETAVEVTILAPMPPRIIASITVELPEPPPVEVTGKVMPWEPAVEQPQLPDGDMDT